MADPKHRFVESPKRSRQSSQSVKTLLHGCWSQEEFAELCALQTTPLKNQWLKLAEHFKRTPSQVRSKWRYENEVDCKTARSARGKSSKLIVKGKWSPADEVTLAALQDKPDFKNKWTKLGKILNRTAEQVRKKVIGIIEKEFQMRYKSERSNEFEASNSTPETECSSLEGTGRSSSTTLHAKTSGSPKTSERNEERVKGRVASANISAALEPDDQLISISEDSDANEDEVDELSTECFGIPFKYETLFCLWHNNLLNGDVITVYFKLLQERHSKDRKYRSCIAMDTFFWTQLTQGGKAYCFENVAHWHDAESLFKVELILIPVHVNGNHWCLGYVDLYRKQVRYLDSFGRINDTFEQNIMRFLKDKWDASGKPDVFPFACMNEGNYHVNIPKQSNEYDCGVFVCKFAECLTRDEGFEFDQRDMEKARFNILCRILLRSLDH